MKFLCLLNKRVLLFRVPWRPVARDHRFSLLSQLGSVLEIDDGIFLLTIILIFTIISILKPTIG